MKLIQSTWGRTRFKASLKPSGAWGLPARLGSGFPGSHQLSRLDDLTQVVGVVIGDEQHLP